MGFPEPRENSFNMKRIQSSLLVVLGFLITGCATFQDSAPKCIEGQQVFVTDSLYFGTATPEGVVTFEDWTIFLSTVVTPRFPSGLSVWPASGQWRAEDGEIVQENSFVLNLIHADDEASEIAIKQITQEYKKKFSQEAVLRVRSSACVSF